MNLHVIFSDQLSVDEIDAQFVKAIQHSIKLSPDIDGIEFRGVATKENLENLGEQIKQSSPVQINETNLKVGFFNINFDYEVVLEIVKGYFKGKCLTAVGKSEWDTMRWTGSAAEKKNTINRASFSFISLQNFEDHQKHSDKLKSEGVRSFLLDCSDAHSFSTKKEEKDRIGNCFTWIKSDLTFEGLKQVANDTSRVFIGDTPPLLIRKKNNPTRFIDSLTVKKVNGSSLTEKWFEDFELVFNPSMVAIIGNKGQGKSAISDIIGLLGNTPNYEDFSFLNKEKFRKRKPLNKSEHFEASLSWLDGTTDFNNLDENPEESSVEKVKYLPQNFLEKLCNEDLKEFENELRNVIFSHLSESDKLGKENLDELIEFQSEVIQDDIEEIQSKLQSANKKIIDLERKKSDKHRKTLEEKLNEKNKELKAHEASKPTPVEAPTNESVIEKNKQFTERISAIRNEIVTLNDEVEKTQNILATTKLDIADIEKALQSISSFQNQFIALRDEVEPIFEKHSLNFEKSVTVKIDKSDLEKLLKENQEHSIELNQSISNDDKTGFLNKKESLQLELKKLQEKLDEQSKVYQNFLDEMRLWEEKHKQIIGDKEKDGTINALKHQIKYIEEKLSANLEVQTQIRKNYTLELFQKKQEIIRLYKNLFKPITEFIRNYGDLLSDYSIELDVDFKIVGLTEKFFDHISLGSKGSFIGNPAGIERLNKIIDNHDLKSSEGIVSYLDEVILNLHQDQREDHEKSKRDLENQLKKGYSILDLYSFLFNLDYLEPEYKLKLGDKNLSELSPGERGALLLIFYLTLDQDDVPLVIDQPEENLDNQSVFKILVQFIKRAKDKRQIIIVTHNPNLAVACNAEQILHVNMAKDDGNKISVTSGSLEYPKINDAVIDILEGTYPALNTRTDTYKIIERKRVSST